MAYIMVSTLDGKNNPHYATVTTNTSSVLTTIASNNQSLGLNLIVSPNGTSANGVTNSSAGQLETEIENYLISQNIAYYKQYTQIPQSVANTTVWMNVYPVVFAW